MNASKKSAGNLRKRTPAVARKQERAIQTRKDLTGAARQIFARDGFEIARVEDIAAAAGKTRGAFYANFKDKEDVFFAIFEEDLSRDREQVGLQLSEASCAEERVRALARHFGAVIKDRARMMLALEFKQYAVRHPRRQKRLAALHREMCARCMEADLNKLLPEFACANIEQKRRHSAQIGAILDGLALNCMFDAGILSEEQVLRQIQANLRVVLETA